MWSLKHCTLKKNLLFTSFSTAIEFSYNILYFIWEPMINKPCFIVGSLYFTLSLFLLCILLLNCMYETIMLCGMWNINTKNKKKKNEIDFNSVIIDFNTVINL